MIHEPPLRNSKPFLEITPFYGPYDISSVANGFPTYSMDHINQNWAQYNIKDRKLTQSCSCGSCSLGQIWQSFKWSSELLKIIGQLFKFLKILLRLRNRLYSTEYTWFESVTTVENSIQLRPVAKTCRLVWFWYLFGLRGVISPPLEI